MKYVNRAPERTLIQSGSAIKPIAKIPLTMKNQPHPLKAVLFGPVLQADVVRHSGDARQWVNGLLHNEKIGAQWDELQEVPIAFSDIPLRD